jgi:hypothetical protein
MVGSFQFARRGLLLCIAAAGIDCGDVDLAAARPEFSISVSGETGTLSQGATATYIIATDPAERDSQPLALSVTGLPAGVSAVLAPSTLDSGETALLELSAAPTAAPAAATFTITAVAFKGSTRKTTGQVNIVAAQ